MKILAQLPTEIQDLIKNMAASAGYSDHTETERKRFIEGAIAMYHHQQDIINRLEVEIDQLEGGAE